MSTTKTHKKFICFTILTASSGFSAPILHAAEASSARLEEVIVTAQKREENIQSVPLSISALTSDDLARKGLTNISEIAAASPSITMAPGYSSSDTLVIFMRGMGNVAPAANASEGAVGFYEDGFFIARANALTFDLADVEHVEILRGPQGTLYGKNTTGGALNLVSKLPTGNFGVRQTLDFGSRNLFRSLTAIDFPELGNVSTKLVLLQKSIDGYVKNPGASHDFNEEFQRAGRFQLHWLVSDALTVDYFGEIGRINTTANYFQNDKFDGLTVHNYLYRSSGSARDEAFRPIDLPVSKNKFISHGLTLSYDVSDSLTIKSLTGYRKTNSKSYGDYADAFDFPTFSPFPYSFAQQGRDDARQFSQEFQFIGSALDDRINYVGGLYYFRENDASYSQYQTPDFGPQTSIAGDAHTRTTSQAAYGQVGWTPDILDQRLEIVLGARSTVDKKKAKDALFDRRENARFTSFDPMLTLNYQLAEDVTTYLRVATGYKGGGIYFVDPPYDSTFDPERLTSYELGLKSYAFDHRLRTNVAVFYGKYRDMQVAVPVNLQLMSATYNLARATIKGAEVEAEAVPFDDLRINLSYSYLHTSIDNVDVIAGSPYDSAINPAMAGFGDDLSGLFTIPYAPKTSVSLGADYTVLHFDQGSINAHIDYRWQDQYYSLSNEGPDVPGRELGKTNSYGILNARLSLLIDLPRGDKATLSLWGKNLNDKQHRASTIPFGVNYSLPGSPLGFSSAASSWSEPFSYGVSLAYQY